MSALEEAREALGKAHSHDSTAVADSFSLESIAHALIAIAEALTKGNDNA